MVSNFRVKLFFPSSLFVSFVTSLKQRRHRTEYMGASEQDYLSRILSIKNKNTADT